MNPPRTRSSAQIEAARRNGARSRGPASAVGKAHSAMNARRHGLAGSFTVLPEESPDAFADLHAQLVLRYAPADPVEEFLVRRLAAAMWRLRRAERLEAEVLSTREHRRQAGFEDGGNPHAPQSWDASRLNAITRYESQHERTFLRTLLQLEQHRQGDAFGLEPTEPFPGYGLWHPAPAPLQPEPLQPEPPQAAPPQAAPPVPAAGLRPRHPGVPPLDAPLLGGPGPDCYPGSLADEERGGSG